MSTDANSEYGLSEAYLTPRALGDRLSGLKFIIIGTCQVEHLTATAPLFGYSADHMLYDSWEHSEIPVVTTDNYDAAIIGLTLRSILQEAIGRSMDVAHTLEFWSLEYATASLARAVDILHARVGAIANLYGSIPTFFASFLEPSFDYFGNLNSPNDITSIRLFMRRLNEQFVDVVRHYPNMHYLDINESFNFVGRLHLHDDVVTHFTHSSLIGNWDDAHDAGRILPFVSNLSVFDVTPNIHLLHKIIFNKLADNIKILRQAEQVKLIIVDLDDTLWRGVAAEENIEGWLRNEGWPLGFMEALLYFKRRGGLLAICSKNDTERTVERFREICGDRMSLDDFVSVKINWQPKSENVAEILREVNLLPESTVFIDDNPREIDDVRSRFPNLRCLGGNHHDWRRIILRAPETQVAFVSKESSERTRLVRAHIEREQSARSQTRDEWLRSLQIEQAFTMVGDVEDPKFARSLELINKTNQFNTNGRRWTLAELEAFFSSGGFCLTTALRDKTVDNGIIGVVLVKPGEIVQAVLSCRVFGLGAELAMGSVATSLALIGAASVSASVTDTGKNFSCHEFYSKIGFLPAGDGFSTEASAETPPWIAVTLDDKLQMYLSSAH